MRNPTKHVVRLISPVMLLGVGGAASAAPQGYGEVEQPVDLFYADFDADVVLLSGQRAEDYCTGDSPTSITMRVHERQDGSTLLVGVARDVPLHLYESPLGAPALIGEVCEAMFDDDPGTVPAEPFATGSGVVTSRLLIHADGVVEVTNQAVGRATSAVGEQWVVRGEADLVVVDDVPVGDPADFQSLRVQQVGVRLS